MAGLIPGILKDYEDHYGKSFVIERSDMTVSTTSKIATKFLDESSNAIWLEEQIGKNAAGETVYIKTISQSSTKPTWVPTDAE